jgi:hypothetical protein
VVGDQSADLFFGFLQRTNCLLADSIATLPQKMMPSQRDIDRLFDVFLGK